MTGYRVETAALVAHSQGSQEAAGHFGSLAGLLEQARVSDDCFGPIGEVLAFKYFEGLEECRNLATQAQSFLTQIAEKTSTAAKLYGDMEQSSADALGRFKDLADAAGGGPGGLNELNHAGDAQRKSDFEQNAGYGSSWASTAGDVARASSPPDVAIATINTRMEQLQLITSPGQAFLDNGLGFLIGIVISPLVELILEPAIGDPEQMRSTAKGWSQVAEWLDGVGEHETKRAEATTQAWQGQGGDAFRKQMTEFAAGSAALAADIRGVQQILEIAADLFDAFVEICIDIIQELVMGLIIEWLAALAASWITAGASVGAAGATTTAEVGITGTRLGMKVKGLLGKLKPLIDKLEELLRQLRTGRLKQVVERMEGLRDGNMAQKMLARKIDSNPLAKILTKADPVTGASKTGNRFADGAAKRLAEQMRGQGLDPGDLANGADGSFALTTNLSEAALRMAGMSGTTHKPTAITHGIMENAPGLAVEQGVKYGYNKSQDPESDEERRATEERGFTLE
ncbi:WXG100 family type VII secretion target [Amycolatopsis cynarae]|uniref:WXG100 family type VII secretion target n=1 Tax=Amycolatopsis cynarae TaxID=2995223 RepID=A0ABY7B3G6_9PSEU|nr:WXG100 family type VII secretion target [Amycolatopsis sp. HUAS 11-8]WAL66726.1 WXG100 family type VII secretion target [Amycolatopsis sp. HUAS 11-8]